MRLTGSGAAWRGRLGPRIASATALVALLAGGCAHDLGQYVWADDYRDQPAPTHDSYLISPGDVLSVRVWNQDGMSARARVRPDGRISLPFVNDIEVAGAEPSVVAIRVQARLKEYIVNPVVTVSLEEPAPFEVSILGDVMRPGVYRLEGGATLMKALASAGGLTEMASRERIFLVRFEAGAPSPVRIRFKYEALARAEGAAGRFRLRPGDTVVVE